jgi:hypothetical protein
MDKKSGVYWTLNDQSVRAAGGSTFGGIVPMFTVKGPVGKLVTVTAKDYVDILGWEDTSSYMGLDEMLKSVARLEVVRMNKAPHVGNFCWFSGGTYSSSQTALVPEDLEGFLDSGENPPAFYVAHAVPGDWGEFEFRVVDKGSGVYSLEYREKCDDGAIRVRMRKDFTFDSTSSSYYKKVSFGDLVLSLGSDAFPANFLSTFTDGASSWYAIGGGDNGSKSLTATDINAVGRVVAKSSANVVPLNGFTQSTALVSALIEVMESQLRSVLIDIPDLTGDTADVGLYTPNDDIISYSQCHTWVEVLKRSEYAQAVAIPDRVTTDSGEVYLWPSVNLFKIYAKMYSDYGSVNYPPAGYTYGAISATNLMDSDFNLYGDELKTDRINYQMVGPRGPVMWEQRTLYALDSDLSYANTPFILRDLRERVLTFMSNFNFRYTTPMELLSIQSGLDTILGEFKRNYFLVNYVLEVPSFEEAQAAGRELDIPISVSVINDAEVITINVSLQNASTLRAA